MGDFITNLIADIKFIYELRFPSPFSSFQESVKRLSGPVVLPAEVAAIKAALKRHS